MKLPKLPDDDADFTPDLARKIIEKYQEILRDPRQAVLAEAMEVIDNMRVADAGDFSPSRSGSIDEARSNALYDAHKALRKLAETAP